MPRTIELLRLAKHLQQNSEQRAWTIEILADMYDKLGTLLKMEDLQTHKYTDETLGRFAESFSTVKSCPKALVRNVLDKFFRLDVRDYTEFYVNCKVLYDMSGHSDCLLEDNITRLSTVNTAKCKAFVLHESLTCVSPVTGDMYDFGVENGGYNEIMKGYLVSKNLAFQSVVDLLSGSKEESWPEWEALWSKM